MTLNILPEARTIFLDGNGAPLDAGFVYMYVPNTSTLKTTWQDSAGLIPNSNPIILDADGGALIWGSGAYRQLVQDSLGNTIWDQITVDPGYAVITSFSGTSTTPVLIGTGSKSFTTQSGLQFFPGGTLVIASNASALNYMTGTVTSYNTVTGALVMNVLNVGGSGTFSDWNISISGIQGLPGTVTAVSVASANGFAGTSSGGGTPQLTLSTTVTGLIKGDGTTMSAATSGTDYAPGTSSLATGIVKSTTVTGGLSIAVAADFPTLNQNTTGNAATVTTNANLTGPVTSVGNATTIAAGVVTEAMQLLSDVTTNDVSTSKHGYAPKLPNDATKFLSGVGTYTSPTATFTVGTSTTSLTIGTGTKNYTTQSGLALIAGQFIITASQANAANFMYGQIISYAGTALSLNVTSVGGSGTLADWNIAIAGPQGTSGGGTGTINSGTANQITYYGTTGTTVSGNANLTISTGALTVGSSGVQGSVALSGSTSGTTTLVPAAAASGTLTLPAATSTVAALGVAQTWTAVQTFTSSDFLLKGSSSGTTTVNATAAASGVITVPATTDTLVGKATTDTLTNKTLDTAGTGNVFKINGTTISSISGNSSKVASATGTYTSGHVATFDASGNIQDGGALPTTTGGLLNIQYITASGTYTKTVGTNAQVVKLWGGGGSGADGTTQDGNDSIFDVMTAGGGKKGAGSGGLGGTSSGGDINRTGQKGGNTNASGVGSYGGNAAGGGGTGGGYIQSANAPGGGGGCGASSVGGGGGGYSQKYYSSAVTGISVTIGAATTTATYNGAIGYCEIWEFS